MTWVIDIEHVAGILAGSATIEPGRNAVRASNWQGKSSFVEAVKTALGVSTALTEGRSAGRVQLHTPDGDVDVTLRREDGTVTREGEPYLADEYDRIRARLFACPDETNAVRRAVRAGENLEEVLLRPLDFENLDERIADTRRERDQVETELEAAEEARKRLPTIAEKVSRLESELGELREQRDRLDATDDAGRPDTGDAQRDLAGAQSDLEQAEKRIERLERAIERREDRLAETRETLSTLEVPDVDDVEAEHDAARDRLAEIKREVEVLQSIHAANDVVLSENRLDRITDVDRELTGDTVVCWTCGSETPRSALADQLEELGERLTLLRADLETERDRVEELEARLADVTQTRQRERELETEIADLEDELADRRESLADARENRAEASARVDELTDAVDDTVAELTDLESDIRYREAELSDAREERSSLEARSDQVEVLREERETLQDELEALRTRRDEVTRGTREAFDESLAEVLERFDTGFETARLTADFELVVARDGREASLDALSEGELELLGFVAALAGFEAFDVGETVPVMLVDGVGGLADDNLHALVDYLEDRVDYLVFTAYPEYASFDGTEIDPTDWEIATPGEGAAQ
jgi:chromosome segregation ATPase